MPSSLRIITSSRNRPRPYICLCPSLGLSLSLNINITISIGATPVFGQLAVPNCPQMHAVLQRSSVESFALS
ncbi:hypothetical protein AWZ03_014591 [Drosophila navojoa]|uniref:Uncharacterized protein n=1 Tax=Drosophila navojoa TaxID=7232 RepID=A0A484AQJ7_DRONA|nr:hypothetical protein AWZ03_014591 [Drosophila navojoa]